jgi:peptidyl-prolyl cis-trans isomerase SurA
MINSISFIRKYFSSCLPLQTAYNNFSCLFKIIRHSAWVVLLPAFFLMSNGQLNAQARILDQIVAVVGNSFILQSEIETEIMQMQAQGITPAADSRCDILENHLVQKLLLNQAIVDSIEVTENEVEMELSRRIQFFVQQIGSEEKLEAYYNKSLLEIREDFRDIVREQLRTQYMQQDIIGNVKVSPAEVRRFFNNLPEEDIPMIPSQVEIRQIIKYPEFSEAENFRVRQRLNEIRQRIIDGESFSTMAILYSEDPGSARRGGELGYMARTDLVPEFSKVAFSLKEDRVSPVFQTEFGFHIVQLIDRRGDQVNVRHILMQPAATDQAKAEARASLDSLARVIRTDTLNFRMAAIINTDDEGTRMGGGLVINPHTGGSRFELDQLNPVQYQAVRDMKVGEIAGPLEATDHQGKVFYKLIYLESQTAPHQANLKDDYAYLRELALNEKMMRILDEWVAERRAETYIRIDEAYKTCSFNGKDWVKR